MATFLYIINEHMIKQTQGARYVTWKSRQTGALCFRPSRLAVISDSILKLEEGQEPVWVKNRLVNPPIPTEKEIAIMLLKADAQ